MTLRGLGLLVLASCGGSEPSAPGPGADPASLRPTPSIYQDHDCEGAGQGAVRMEFWADADADGFGDPRAPVQACSQPPGHALQAGDCDDTQASIHPGAPERCNEHDDDCDGSVDEDDAVDAVPWLADADADGYCDPSRQHTACQAQPGWVREGADIDCDDADPRIHPGAPERCNGIDDDCDGVVDGEQARDVLTWYLDADGDGFGDPLTTQLDCAAPAGFIEPGADADCNDAEPGIHPGALELCNGVDDDCDGVVDEDDASDAITFYMDEDGDRFGDPARPLKACKRPRGTSATAGDCDDTRPSAHPESVEVCNGHDDDCDGAVDEPDADDAITWYADSDRDGFGDRDQPRDACYQPTGYVSPRGDCDDRNPAVHPDAGEPPDGIDNDCNGVIDDAVSGG